MEVGGRDFSWFRFQTLDLLPPSSASHALSFSLICLFLLTVLLGPASVLRVLKKVNVL